MAMKTVPPPEVAEVTNSILVLLFTVSYGADGMLLMLQS